MSNREFQTCEQYTETMKRAESDISEAVEAVQTAYFKLQSASDHTYSEEIAILQKMHEKLYQHSLLLCSLGTRSANIKKNRN